LSRSSQNGNGGLSCLPLATGGRRPAGRCCISWAAQCYPRPWRWVKSGQPTASYGGCCLSSARSVFVGPGDAVHCRPTLCPATCTDSGRCSARVRYGRDYQRRMAAKVERHVTAARNRGANLASASRRGTQPLCYNSLKSLNSFPPATNLLSPNRTGVDRCRSAAGGRRLRQQTITPPRHPVILCVEDASEERCK
jgi:hypothetical protein